MNREIDKIIKNNKYRSEFYKKHKNSNQRHVARSVPTKKPPMNKQIFNDSNGIKPVKDERVQQPSSFASRLLLQTVAACLILMVGLIVKHDPKLEPVNTVVTHHINFAKIDNYVVSHLGRLFPLPERDMYVNKPYIDLSYIDDYKHGVIIHTQLYDGVYSQTSGMVIRIYNDKDLGRVVVIQNEDGQLFHYGMMDDVKVGLYSRVSEGDTIGMSKTGDDGGYYYLAIEESGRYVEVTSVIGYGY